MRRFEDKVLATINRFKMIQPGEDVLVAVSGGVDSMTLLHVLQNLPLRLRLFVFHLNHSLRPEAEEEARLVARTCEKWSIPCRIEKVDIRAVKGGESLEAAARTERYRLMAKIARETGSSKIALGHHADDQVETVIMRFLNGAGPQGMAGIPPVRDNYIRPLFEVTREEILRYAREKNLNWAEDSSNLAMEFARNKIRHHLLPLLIREYQPQLKRRIAESSRIFREWEEYLEIEAEDTLRGWGVKKGEKSYSIPVSYWGELPTALKRAVFRELYFSAAAFGARLEFKHSEVFLRLIQGPNGKRARLPGRVEIRKENDSLIIKSWEKREYLKYRIPLQVPGRTELPGGKSWVESRLVTAELLPEDWKRVSPQEAYIDLEGASPPFYLRNRRPGDRFYPLGLGGSKKVQDFFCDRKISGELREEIPLLVDAEDRILWVAGLRLDERGRIGKETKEALHVKYYAGNELL